VPLTNNVFCESEFLLITRGLGLWDEEEEVGDGSASEMCLLQTMCFVSVSVS